MDAFDYDLCTIVRSVELALTYAFNESEQQNRRITLASGSISTTVNYFRVHLQFTRGEPHGRLLAAVTERFPATCTFASTTRPPSAGKRRLLLGITKLKPSSGCTACEKPSGTCASHRRMLPENLIADAGSRRSNCTSSTNRFASMTHGWTQAAPSSTDLETIWHTIPGHTPSQHRRTINTSSHYERGSSGAIAVAFHRRSPFSILQIFRHLGLPRRIRLRSPGTRIYHLGDSNRYSALLCSCRARFPLRPSTNSHAFEGHQPP